MTNPPNPPPPTGGPPYGGEIPPNEPGYGYTDGPQPGRPKNGFGTTGLVLGIIGAATGWLIPCMGWILGILAIIFGGMGIQRANKREATNKNAAIVGLVLGIVAIVVGTLAVSFWADVNADWMNQ